MGHWLSPSRSVFSDGTCWPDHLVQGSSRGGPAPALDRGSCVSWALVQKALLFKPVLHICRDVRQLLIDPSHVPSLTDRQINIDVKMKGVLSAFKVPHVLDFIHTEFPLGPEVAGQAVLGPGEKRSAERLTNSTLFGLCFYLRASRTHRYRRSTP